MKIFAAVAISVSVLIGAEEVTRPEIIFTEGSSFFYTGDFDFTPGKKQKYASSFKVTEVTKDGSHWSSTALMTYGFDGVPETKTYLFQFACDSLNYYIHSRNALFREVQKVKSGDDNTSGDSLIYPLRMEVGDTLPDAWCKTQMRSSEGTTIGLMEFTRRKVESLDTLNLNIGKIPAYKIVTLEVITTHVNSSYSGKREEKDYVTVTEWFSPQYGVVKSLGKTKNYISVVALDSYSDK